MSWAEIHDFWDMAFFRSLSLLVFLESPEAMQIASGFFIIWKKSTN